MILHLTHYDLDGIGCEIIIKSLFKNVNTIYLNRKNWNIQLEYIINNNFIENNLIITDWQLTNNEFQKIVNNNYFKKIIYIDHHLIKDPINFPLNCYYLIDKNYSASVLTYKFFEKLINKKIKNKNILKKFIKYVNDYDMWHLKYKESLILQFAMKHYGSRLFYLKMKKNLENNIIITENFKEIYKNSIEEIKSYIFKIKNNKLYINHGNDIIILPFFKHLNEFTIFEKKYKVYIFFKEENENFIFSLRSRNIKINFYDIYQNIKNKYPELYMEGGGHAYAFGLKLKKLEDLDIFIKEIKEKIKGIKNG